MPNGFGVRGELHCEFDGEGQADESEIGVGQPLPVLDGTLNQPLRGDEEPVVDDACSKSDDVLECFEIDLDTVADAELKIDRAGELTEKRGE